MDHSEAVQQMAAERYLMDELTLDAREAFEEHLFDCSECALDLRAGVAFVNEAKAQLPALTASAPVKATTAKAKAKRQGWLSWWQPAIAAPVFATLLIVIGYQNLVTYPALREAADQPRLLPQIALRGATRGGAPTVVTADRKHGVALPVELPQENGFSRFSFELHDPQGKLAWTGAIAASPDGDNAAQMVSLVIPGAILQSGAYTLTVSGIASQGQQTTLDRYAFDLHLSE
jgi:hypothetical protein